MIRLTRLFSGNCACRALCWRCSLAACWASPVRSCRDTCAIRWPSLPCLAFPMRQRSGPSSPFISGWRSRMIYSCRSCRLPAGLARWHSCSDWPPAVIPFSASSSAASPSAHWRARPSALRSTCHPIHLPPWKLPAGSWDHLRTAPSPISGLPFPAFWLVPACCCAQVRHLMPCRWEKTAPSASALILCACVLSSASALRLAWAVRLPSQVPSVSSG